MTGSLAAVVAVLLSAAMTGACGQENIRVGAVPSAVAQSASTSSASAPPASASPLAASPPPPGFVDLSDVDPTILMDIRYHTEHNFVGRRIDGYHAARCLLTTKAAQKLREAQRAANAKGLSLKMYDCYRPVRAVDYFKRWAALPDAQEMKAEFYPSLSKSDLLTGDWIASGRSSHSRGSTVDLTLVALPPAAQRPYVPGENLLSCTAPAGQRFPDNTVDMGTGYDCFDTRSHTGDSRVPAQAKQNRQTLKQLMTAAGFVNFANEWWHYRLVDEPFPNDVFDFPINP